MQRVPVLPNYNKSYIDKAQMSPSQYRERGFRAPPISCGATELLSHPKDLPGSRGPLDLQICVNAMTAQTLLYRSALQDAAMGSPPPFGTCCQCQTPLLGWDHRDFLTSSPHTAELSSEAGLFSSLLSPSRVSKGILLV